MMITLGLIVLCATIYALVKRYETRLVLMTSGLFLAFVTLKPMLAFNQFVASMTNGGLIQTIVSVMGFACVMSYTKCDAHLVHGVTGFARHFKGLIIPLAAIITFFINISLPSAAGVAAAVGAILIPMLISLGVAPATAGSAVMLGTYGSMLSPGLSHNGMIADMAKIPVVEVIGIHYQTSLVTILVGAACLTAVAYFLGENKGYVDHSGEFQEVESIKVNPLYAIIPVTPVIMLVLGARFPELFPWLAPLKVPHCMLIGAIIGLVVTRSNPTEATKQFFDGTGNAYAQIMGIIIAAGVFVSGLRASGLIDAGIALMKESEGVVSLAAAAGPFVLAVISGSGDAATLAFNQAVTVHASTFGMTIPEMGSLATLGGALGRTMSPLTGAAIICASLAKVNPMELSKRNALGMVCALIVTYVMLG